MREYISKKQHSEDFDHQMQERKELDEWINMRATITERDIQYLQKIFKNRPSKHKLYLVVRANIPVFDVKYTWRCYLEIHNEQGKIHKRNKKEEWKMKASPAFVESILNDTLWTETRYGTVSFYKKELGNKQVVEVSPPKPIQQELIFPPHQPESNDSHLLINKFL